MRSLFFNEDQTPKYRLFWLIATIIVVIWISQFLALKYYFIPNSLNNEPKDEESIWTHRGVIGDSFGAINALFSGLAFAGVIFAILLQRADIKRQHIETKEQANDFAKEIQEIQKQTEAIVSQLEEAKNQTRELTRQIRLSIMPAFVIEVMQNVENNISSWYLRMSNIGNGSATNIVFENIEHIHTNPTVHVTKTIIEIYTIPFMEARKGPVILQRTGKSYNSAGTITATPISQNTFTDIILGYSKENPCRLKLTFEDIEGTKYEQEIKIANRVSIPGKVKEVK